MNTKLVSSMDSIAGSRLVTIGVDALLVGAAELLSTTQIGLVVVCDSVGAMAGVITKTDIVHQIARCQANACTLPLTDVMSRNVAYCHPGDRLLDVLSMMQKRDFVHSPVVDENFKPTGVVNARDALRELMEEGEYEASLLRDYVMGVGYR